MWHERGAWRKGGLATAQISASAVCARAQPWKAGGHNIVEQISSNLSVLVPGPSGGKAALLCPPLPVPPISPVYPSQCQHTARRMRCQQGGAAVWGGVSSCRGPGPSVDRSCVLSAGRRFALEKRSGAEKSWHGVFWSAPTCILAADATSSTSTPLSLLEWERMFRFSSCLDARNKPF